MLLLQQGANGKLKGSPLFDFYQPGTFATTVKDKNGKAQAVTFQTATDYLQTGDVNILVNPASAAAYSVLLRKPYWAANYSVKVNGVELSSKETELITINRSWKKGDRISIHFDMPLTALDGGKSYPGMVAFQRGPQVLAFDKTINNTDAGSFQLSPTNIAVTEDASALPKDWIGKQGYMLSTATGGNVLLVPYADASQTGGVVATWLKKKEQ